MEELTSSAHVMKGVQLTRTSDIDIHTVGIDFPLRRSGRHGRDAQVSGVQVLLGPLPVVRLVVRVGQHRLLLELRNNRGNEHPAKHTSWGGSGALSSSVGSSTSPHGAFVTCRFAQELAAAMCGADWVPEGPSAPCCSFRDNTQRVTARSTKRGRGSELTLNFLVSKVSSSPHSFWLSSISVPSEAFLRGLEK